MRGLGYGGLVLIAVAGFLGAGLFFLVPEDAVRSAIREGGFIEHMTLLAYVTLLVSFVKLTTCVDEDLSALGALVGLLIVRELDMHLHLNWLGLVHGDDFRLIPDFGFGLIDSVVSAVAICVVLAVVFGVTRTHIRAFVSGLRAREAVSLAVGLGVVFLVFAKLLDAGYKRLQVLGFDVGPEDWLFFDYLEEGFELAAPAAFLFAAGLKLIESGAGRRAIGPALDISMGRRPAAP